MKGRRVQANENGTVILADGDYGKDDLGAWHIRPPGCHAGSIPHHTVTEYPDGSITVLPSIVLDDGVKKWHGYLERGIWREA